MIGLIECGAISLSKSRGPQSSLRLLVQTDQLVASPLEDLAGKTPV